MLDITLYNSGMDYLERCRRVASEVTREGLSFQRGAKIGKSSFLTFRALGSYPSAELGSELYLGIKEISETLGSATDHIYYRRRAAIELAILAEIAKNLPHRIPQLPSFYGLGMNGRNQVVGIVMEDLSRAGQATVEPIKVRPGDFYPDRTLVKEISGLFDDLVGEAELGDATFNVSGREKPVMLDLDILIHGPKIEAARVAMYEVLDQYSVRIKPRRS